MEHGTTTAGESGAGAPDARETGTGVDWELPDLVPARMINEYCYCPRLAYLEWVQGEWAESADTLDGSHVHRRVDKPGGKLPPPGTEKEEAEAEDEPPERIHARSVHLSAPEFGVIAVIDLLEDDGGAAVTPVDYKRGRAPDIPEGAWDADRVQLCAQGLVLRENGYATEGGVIYYAASKTRVPIPFGDELCELTRDHLHGLRESGASGRIPAPLEDSPKCPRCSLVGICLPDETRLLARGDAAGPETAEDPPVRPLIAPRDDARPLYVQEQGARLGLKGNELEVRAPRSKTVLASVRLTELNHVTLFGAVQVSSQAVSRLCREGIPITYLSYGGWFNGMTFGLPSKNIELRQRQFAAAADDERSLECARAFVAGKIENQRTLLRRNAAEAAPEILAKLKRLAERARAADNPGTLLGIEGNAARLYFSRFDDMLKPRGEATEAVFSLQFDKRNRRPPTDPVNALLSYAYALLTKDLTIACWAVGFDPFLGLFHRPRYGRPALALDLMEEFRPIVADSCVLTAVNNGEVAARDFLWRGPAVSLKPEGRKRFLRAYERRMDTTVTHPLFGYPVTYRRAMELQARILARTLSGEMPAYVPFRTR